AQVWMASPEGLSLELGYPIPESWRSRLASMPEVVDTEPYLYGFSYWRKPRGGSEVCCVIGSQLKRGALGVVSDLTPRMRTMLTEPGAIVVDETELERLGVAGGGGAAPGARRGGGGGAAGRGAQRPGASRAWGLLTSSARSGRPTSSSRSSAIIPDTRCICWGAAAPRATPRSSPVA